MGKRIVLVFVVAVLAVSASHGQERTRQKGKVKRNNFGADRIVVYKTVGDTKLTMRLYLPKNHKRGTKRPAIVFFFGGGWRGGSPKQFAQHARYLASRGMVALTADYRVFNRHKVKVVACVGDALAAIRWVRAQADKLGVDPERIVASGGSAGGHLAAATATLTLEGFDAVGQDQSISARPNALILFNPALDLRPAAFNIEAKSKRYQELLTRFGTQAEKLSPTVNVKKGIGPTIVFHGKADKTVPFAQAEGFQAAMKKAGNRCEVAGYEGQGHGFFNFGRGGNKNFVATVREADRFLVSLGYLQGTATVEKFMRK